MDYFQMCFLCTVDLRIYFIREDNAGNSLNKTFIKRYISRYYSDREYCCESKNRWKLLCFNSVNNLYSTLKCCQSDIQWTSNQKPGNFAFNKWDNWEIAGFQNQESLRKNKSAQ